MAHGKVYIQLWEQILKSYDIARYICNSLSDESMEY
jgi:hypothetical protein